MLRRELPPKWFDVHTLNIPVSINSARHRTLCCKGALPLASKVSKSTPVCAIGGGTPVEKVFHVPGQPSQPRWKELYIPDFTSKPTLRPGFFKKHNPHSLPSGWPDYSHL